MVGFISKFLNGQKRRKDARDEKYINEIKCKVQNATDEQLKEMLIDFYNGIDGSLQIGDAINDTTLTMSSLIVAEMNKRGLNKLEELEEEIWFLQNLG